MGILLPSAKATPKLDALDRFMAGAWAPVPRLSVFPPPGEERSEKAGLLPDLSVLEPLVMEPPLGRFPDGPLLPLSSGPFCGLSHADLGRMHFRECKKMPQARFLSVIQATP